VLALFFTALGLASWLGSAIFMNFIVAPVVNRRLAPSQAAELMEQVAPRQHWVGWFGAGLMAVGGAGALLYHPWRVPTIAFLVLTSIALALSLYAALVVLPRTISLRK